MYRYLFRNKTWVTGAMAATLVASAFQPVGCNVNLDPATLQVLQNLATQFLSQTGGTVGSGGGSTGGDTSGGGTTGGTEEHHFTPPPPPPPCDGCQPPSGDTSSGTGEHSNPV